MSLSAKIQSITGTVVRISNPTTFKVSTKVTKIHPVYRKRFTLTRSYVAHNPGTELSVGDTVTIVSCRPVSKTKSWVLSAPTA